MKKLILLFIALLFVGSAQANYYGVVARKNAVSCDTETYAPSLTESATWTVSYNASSIWSGFTYVPASNQDICKIDLYIGLVSGTLDAGDEFYLAIYSIGAVSALDTELGRSGKIEGSSFTTDTWTSANAGYFEFSPAVSLTSGTSYGIALFRDDDGNPDDTPEVDVTNFPRLGNDDENNGDSIQTGAKQWQSDKSVSTSDDQDDIMVKVYTQ